jgi:hypothetical protein
MNVFVRKQTVINRFWTKYERFLTYFMAYVGRQDTQEIKTNPLAYNSLLKKP